MHVAAANQVQVKVEDGLAGTRADVIHGPVSVLDAALVRNFRRDEVRVADDLRVFRRSFLDADDVFLGNNEQVRGRLRANVFDREDMVVFVDLLRGDLPGEDVAEQAIRHASQFQRFARKLQAR